VGQKLAECEANVVRKLARVSEVRFLIEKAKKRRQAK
jgi:hypothetical protein